MLYLFCFSGYNYAILVYKRTTARFPTSLCEERKKGKKQKGGGGGRKKEEEKPPNHLMR